MLDIPITSDFLKRHTSIKMHSVAQFFCLLISFYPLKHSGSFVYNIKINYLMYYKTHMCHGNIVQWPGYSLDNQWIVFQFLSGTRNFLFLQNIWTGSMVHSVSLSIGNRALCPEVKQPGHETDRWPPCIVVLRFRLSCF
jgi:hypothetical protein